MKVEVLFKDQKVDTKIRKIVVKVVNLVCTYLSVNHKHIELSVLLVNDKFMQNLNLKYRNKFETTNVLSFPQNKHLVWSNSEKLNLLGDIVLSPDKIKEESVMYLRDFYEHFIHIFLHGFLHLLGYTHDSENDTKNMEAKEIEILSLLNINNPYLPHTEKDEK